MNQQCFAIAAVALALWSPHACADEAATLNGNWRVTFTARNGNAFTGYLAVEGESGKWRSIAQSMVQGRNPCYGREFPVTIANADASKATLSVNASASMPGCTDFTISATSTDGKEWSGAMEDGRPVRFERQ